MGGFTRPSPCRHRRQLRRRWKARLTGAAAGEAGVELPAADWKALLTAQNAGIPNLPTMAELTKSAPVSVTISSNASPAKFDPEKAASRDRIFVIVAALAVAALIAALLLQGSDCL